MSKADAIEDLKQSKNVADWNSRMSNIKRFLSQIEVAQIEQSGLIVEVLGKDKQQ